MAGALRLSILYFDPFHLLLLGFEFSFVAYELSTMASRIGKHESGTDGLDYSHRERVASHYTASVQNKASLLRVIYCHLGLAVLAVIHMAFQYLNGGLKLWEPIWMVTAASCILAVLALPRNQVYLLALFAGTNLLLGLGCCVYGIHTSFLAGDFVCLFGCCVGNAIHILEAFYVKNLLVASTQWKTKR